MLHASHYNFFVFFTKKVFFCGKMAKRRLFFIGIKYADKLGKKSWQLRNFFKETKMIKRQCTKLPQVGSHFPEKK